MSCQEPLSVVGDVVASVVVVGLGVFGCAGSLLVLYQQQAVPTPRPLLRHVSALCLWDIGLLLSGVGHQLTTTTVPASTLVRSFTLLYTVTLYGSTWQLLNIAMQRYAAVTSPLGEKSRKRRCVSAFCIVFAVVGACVFGVASWMLVCKKSRWMELVLTGPLPSILLLFLTVGTARVCYRNQQPHNYNSTNKTSTFSNASNQNLLRKLSPRPQKRMPTQTQTSPKPNILLATDPFLTRSGRSSNAYSVRRFRSYSRTSRLGRRQCVVPILLVGCLALKFLVAHGSLTVSAVCGGLLFNCRRGDRLLQQLSQLLILSHSATNWLIFLKWQKSSSSSSSKEIGSCVREASCRRRLQGPNSNSSRRRISVAVPSEQVFGKEDLLRLGRMWRTIRSMKADVGGRLCLSVAKQNPFMVARFCSDNPLITARFDSAPSAADQAATDGSTRLQKLKQSHKLRSAGIRINNFIDHTIQEMQLHPKDGNTMVQIRKELREVGQVHYAQAVIMQKADWMLLKSELSAVLLEGSDNVDLDSPIVSKLASFLIHEIKCGYLCSQLDEKGEGAAGSSCRSRNENDEQKQPATACCSRSGTFRQRLKPDEHLRRASYLIQDMLIDIAFPTSHAHLPQDEEASGETGGNRDLTKTNSVPPPVGEEGRRTEGVDCHLHITSL